MKIEKRFEIDKATCKKGSGRRVLEFTYLDKSNKDFPRLVATNGKILAVVPAWHAEEDHEGFINPDAIKTGRTKGDRRLPMFGLSANGEVKVETKEGQVTYRRDENEGCNFPKWRDIFKGIVHPKAPHARIKINAKLLCDLANAIGSEEVELTIPTCGDRAMLVRGLKGPGYGAIMPITISK